MRRKVTSLHQLKINKQGLVRNLSLKMHFYEAALEHGLATSTTYRYWRWVRRLLLFRQPVQHPSLLSDKAVIEFIHSLEKRGLSKKSISQASDAINFLYCYVIEDRKSIKNKIDQLKIQSKSTRESIRIKIRKLLLKCFIRK